MTVHRSFITISEWQIEIKSDFKLSNNLKDLGKLLALHIGRGVEKRMVNSIQFYKYNFHKLVKFYEKEAFTDFPIYYSI